MAKKNKIDIPVVNNIVAVNFIMKFKRPVRRSKEAVIFNAMRESFLKLEHDYIPDIEVEIYSMLKEGSCSGTIYVTKKFALEHLCFDGKYSPEKYLGFYLSRLARNLRKKDKYFATTFDCGGMFTYRFFY